MNASAFSFPQVKLVVILDKINNPFAFTNGLYLVRVTGVEPARIAAQEPKSCVYANFTIPAQQGHYSIKVRKVNNYLAYSIPTILFLKEHGKVLQRTLRIL